jgi:CHAT domain-containing protein/tetratricopeptide (TPR) repeat protein
MKNFRLFAVLALLFITVSSFAYKDDDVFFMYINKYRYYLYMNKVETHIKQGNYALAANEYFNLYVGFQDRVGITKCERYGHLLLDLSELLLKIDRQNEALFIAWESEAFWEKYAGESSMYYVGSLCRCLESIIAQGDTPKAIKYLEKLKSINYSGPDKDGFLLTIDEFEAQVEYELKHFEKAENLWVKVKKANPQRELTNQIINCKIALGKYDEAIALIKENINVENEITSAKEAHMVSSYAYILAKEKSTLQEAIKQQEKVIKYIKSQANTLSINYAASLSSLFNYLAAADDVDKSIEIAKRATNIYENLLPYGNIIYTEFLVFSSSFLAGKGVHDIANKYALRATNLKFNYITYNMLVTNPEERQKLWNEEGKWFLSTFPSMTSSSPTDDMLKAAYNSLLIGKGMLLNTEKSISEVANKKGGKIKQLSDELNEIENKLNGPHSMAEDSLLRKKSTSLSNELGLACSKDPSLNIYLAYTWEDVRKSLKEGEKAIEFFVSSEFVDEPSYNALIIGKDDECPALVKLCKASELSSISRTDVGMSAYELVWKKMETLLQGVENVYFSPDGILYQMPIETSLKSIKGINAIRLSSTRQLLARQSNWSLPQNADIFGGFQYGENLAKISSNKVRAGMGDLPATKIEAETCMKLLNNASVATSSHLGSLGTEESFKNISGTETNLIHIATHSILMDNNFLEEISSDSLTSEELTKIDMMNRAALLFSGANSTIKGSNYKDNTNDGILTASEIAKLDLQDVDLAVLSACETALGDVSGEGVFGLQRGFKKAGVKSIMMSLWKVDDDATMLFMKSFYKSWIENESHNKVKALYDAQDAVKSFKGNINGKYRDFSDSQYWASFVLLDAI